MKTLDLLKLSPVVSWQYLTGGENFVFDCSKAKKQLGWKPKYNDTEMIIKTYDWFLKNYDEISKLKEGTTHRQITGEGILNIINRLT